MSGQIISQGFIRRSDLRRNPDTLYVFGDNLARRGYGGQAREMRGEPNAVGVPTKKAPHNGASAFLRDADFDTARPAIDAAFDRIRAHLASGGDVVFPTDGVGSGRARLEHTAPAIADYVRRQIQTVYAYELRCAENGATP